MPSFVTRVTVKVNLFQTFEGSAAVLLVRLERVPGHFDGENGRDIVFRC